MSRFDDHVAYYTLERTFHERHGVSIPRQQMVQWVEHIAGLLQPLCLALLEGMLRGGYLQVDETPVKVLDPEVKGRCAQGYLWFYAVPGGDVFLDFQDTRGQRAPHARLKDYVGTIQTDAYEVYDALKKSIAGLIRIGCLAHARRRFYRALKDKDPALCRSSDLSVNCTPSSAKPRNSSRSNVINFASKRPRSSGHP